MAKYYLNKNAQENGDMEIHAESCKYFPAEKNRILIGDYPNAEEALKAIREKIDGCVHCSKEAHSS